MSHVRKAASSIDTKLSGARCHNGNHGSHLLALSTATADKVSMLRSPVRSIRAAILLSLALISCFAAASAQTVTRFPERPLWAPTAPPLPVSILITRAGTLDSVKVRTQGNDGFDFTDAGGDSCSAGTSYSVGQLCTVNVAFGPSAPGERRGAVVLLDSNKAVLATQFLTATATGPLNTFIPGTIDTVAGQATWIYSGDGGIATQSSIFLPFGVAVDAFGDIFISDSSNNRIRMVNGSTQIISTIAGNGTLGSTGDGGPATQATISNPTALLVDPAGNVFFADNGNNVIRKISAFDGTISTIAASSTAMATPATTVLPPPPPSMPRTESPSTPRAISTSQTPPTTSFAK